MTTLYRPILIESVAQAEALPVGTVVTSIQGDLPVSAIKAYDDEDGDGWMSTLGIYHHDGNLVGWSALAPIEAEEEWALIYDGEDPTLCADEADAREWARIDGEGQAPSRRYTTPWESA